jgi:hypothetical protein
MKIRLAITAAALAAVTMQVHATEGINLIGIGPVQQGTAGAGVASAKDSTWLILNPAGLTDVDMGVDASLHRCNTSLRFVRLIPRSRVQVSRKMIPRL